MVSSLYRAPQKATEPRTSARGFFRGDCSPALIKSATETNLPARPLFARVGGRVLILSPALRRGAFFVGGRIMVHFGSQSGYIFAGDRLHRTVDGINVRPSS